MDSEKLNKLLEDMNMNVEESEVNFKDKKKKGGKDDKENEDKNVLNKKVDDNLGKEW